VPKLPLTLLFKWVQEFGVDLRSKADSYRDIAAIVKCLIAPSAMFFNHAQPSKVEFRFETVCARWLQLFVGCALRACHDGECSLQLVDDTPTSDSGVSTSSSTSTMSSATSNRPSFTLLPGFKVLHGEPPPTEKLIVYHRSLCFQFKTLLVSNNQAAGERGVPQLFVVPNALGEATVKPELKPADPSMRVVGCPVVAANCESAWDILLPMPTSLWLFQVKFRDTNIATKTVIDAVKHLREYQGVLWSSRSSPSPPKLNGLHGFPHYQEKNVVFVILSVTGVAKARGNPGTRTGKC